MAIGRVVRTYLLVAFAFAALGFGNLIFGQHKHREYTHQLLKAEAELTTPERKPIVPLVSPVLNFDRQSRHISRLKARLEFYQVVTIGGKAFLLLAVFLALMGFLGIKQEGPLD